MAKTPIVMVFVTKTRKEARKSLEGNLIRMKREARKKLEENLILTRKGAKKWPGEDLNQWKMNASKGNAETEKHVRKRTIAKLLKGLNTSNKHMKNIFHPKQQPIHRNHPL